LTTDCHSFGFRPTAEENKFTYLQYTESKVIGKHLVIREMD